MCKRQAGVKLLEEERNLEGYIDEISEDHAKLVLDRLDLLSKLREIARHSKLDERVKLCENNLDTPDWWVPGKHDRELIRAVLKHGLYRSDQFILNDTDFPFFEAEKRYLRDLETHIQQMIKAERDQKETELKKEMKEEADRVEKAEKDKMEEEEKKMLELIQAEEDKEKESRVEESDKPTSSDEKDGDTEEKEAEIDTDDTESKVKDPELEQMELDQTEKVSETPETSDISSPKAENDSEKMETDEKEPEKEDKLESKEDILDDNKKTPTDEAEQVEKFITEEQPEELKASEDSEAEKSKPEVSETDEEEKVSEVPKEPETTEKAKEETEQVENKEIELTETKKEPLKEEIEELETPTDVEIKQEKIKSIEQVPIKQAVELKSRYPDLEVFQPLLKLKQLDSQLSDSKGSLKPFTNLLDTTMVVKWFRDFALEKRIGHIVYCIDNNEWPVGKSYSAYTGCLGIDLDAPLYETIKRIIPIDDNRRSAASTPDIITITTDKNITQQITEAAALRSSALSTQALNQSMAAVAAANSSGRGKGKKRHIAIDVETERAKLHALLNNTVGPGGQQSSSDFKTPKRNMGKQQQVDLLGLSQKALWEQAEQELNAMDMRNTRTTRGSQQSTQPPPAHQHQSSRSNVQNYKQSTVIPGTSSTLTPIDLSSR